MLKKEVAGGRGLRVVLVDSITKLTADDAGAVVVSGSHGGSSSAEFALAVPLAAVFFNDAGIGKDEAGVVALRLLQEHGIAAGTVSHTSARIGDAQDAWDHGIVSRVNEAAAALRIAPGARLRDVLLRLLASRGVASGGVDDQNGARRGDGESRRPDASDPEGPG